NGCFDSVDLRQRHAFQFDGPANIAVGGPNKLIEEGPIFPSLVYQAVSDRNGKFFLPFMRATGLLRVKRKLYFWGLWPAVRCWSLRVAPPTRNATIASRKTA